MAYLKMDEYIALYGEISSEVFARLEAAARRKIDRMTTGVDGVRKLKYAFPTDEDDISVIRHCAAALIHAMLDEQAVAAVTETENGVHSNVITSVSAGNESIHYASVGAGTQAEKEAVYTDIIREWLSGVPDANGVNLLYMGPYPYPLEVNA